MPQQYFPRANTSAQRYDDNYPGSMFTYPLKRVVWHTTETNGWPGYSGGASAPTITVRADPATTSLTWRQHFPANMSARALRNLSGGVETNRDECIQVEIIGTCDPHRHSLSPSWLYIPEAPDWVYEGLADFAAWCYTEWGIPLRGMPLWQSYPASYGLKNKNRMTNAEWNAFRGHCGHQHVTENTHGDPGRMAAHGMLLAADARVHPLPIPPQPPPNELNEDEDMFICRTGDGRQYLVYGLAKTHIPSMEVVNELKACGIKDQGVRPSAMLNLFATVEVGDVGAFFGLGAERQVEGLTALGNLQTTATAIEDKVDALTPPPVPPSPA